MDHDSCLIADHRRGVVFFLTWDGMVENLGQPYGQGFRAAHAARLCYEDLPRGHEISDPIREGEKGRLVSLRFRDALQPFAGTLVRAAEHDELHGLAGPQQHRYRLFQVPPPRPPPITNATGRSSLSSFKRSKRASSAPTGSSKTGSMGIPVGWIRTSGTPRLATTSAAASSATT